MSAITPDDITLLQQSNALYHALSGQCGLDGLAQMLEEYVRYPVTVCDISYRILARSSASDQLPYGLKAVPGALLLEAAEVESLRRLQIEKQIYQSSEAFLVDTEDHPDSSWVFCAIRSHQIPMGYVAVCLPKDARISKQSLSLITTFANVCALEMQRQDLPADRTGVPYESLLIDLIEGRFTEAEIVSERMAMLGQPAWGFYCMITLERATPHDDHLFHRRQVVALRSHYPGSLAVAYKERILLLVNQSRPVILSEEFLSPLSSFCTRNEMIAGISQPFANIIKVPQYYDQSIQTLRLSDTSDPSVRLYHSTEALLPYLFSNCDYAGLQIGIHHHIYHLMDYDRLHNTDFIQTLRTFFLCDRNAATAAQALHIHRSTFFYRIKKIEDLLDVSITDSHLLFLYELSFYILDYLSR